MPPPIEIERHALRLRSRGLKVLFPRVKTHKDLVSSLLVLLMWFQVSGLLSGCRATQRSSSAAVLSEGTVGGVGLSHSAAAAALSDDELLKVVFNKLLEEARPRAGLQWPPKLAAFDRATERALRVSPDAAIAGTWFDADEGVSKIAFTGAMMREVIQGNADRLAFFMGHEMAHVLLEHRVHRLERGAAVEPPRAPPPLCQQP